MAFKLLYNRTTFDQFANQSKSRTGLMDDRREGIAPFFLKKKRKRCSSETHLFLYPLFLKLQIIYLRKLAKGNYIK